MDFFRRLKKEKPKPPPKPAWLKWALLAFIGYAILMTSMPGNKAHESAKRAQVKIAQSGVADINQYKAKLFPNDAAGLHVREVEEGSGNPAACGQKVAVAYETFLAQGNELDDKATKEKPLRFTIGDGQVMPVFDRGTLGMKVGGKRSVVAPPLMSYGLEGYKRDDVPGGANVRFEMELLSAEPKIPEVAVMPYRIAEVAPGNGMPIACGEPAHLRINLWDLSGNLLYSNKDDKEPLTITPGRAEVMLGLEQGVLGLQEGGTRLLIIPPAFQQTLTGAKPKISLPLPKDQTVMVEAQAVLE